MSSFQDLGVFVHNNPETETQRSSAQAALNYNTDRGSLRCAACEVIVNEKSLNLIMTKSCVLSVILINL